MPDHRTVHVQCGACLGKGTVMHERQTQAIRLVSSEWQSTSALADRMGISVTNAANVLRDLYRAGHVERRGSGAHHSPYEWRLAPSDLEPAPEPKEPSP